MTDVRDPDEAKGRRSGQARLDAIGQTTDAEIMSLVRLTRVGMAGEEGAP